MENFKGTKGEWTLSDHNFRCPEILNESNQVIFTHNKVCYDALEDVNQYYSHNKMVANAKLIAAAPDLLEALQGLIDPLTGLVSDYVANIIGSVRASKIESSISKALRQ